jgi:hypothetical protein
LGLNFTHEFKNLYFVHAFSSYSFLFFLFVSFITKSALEQFKTKLFLRKKQQACLKVTPLQLALMAGHSDPTESPFQGRNRCSRSWHSAEWLNSKLK